MSKKNTIKNLRSSEQDNLKDLYDNLPESEDEELDEEEKEKEKIEIIKEIKKQDEKIINKERKFRNFQRFIFNIILLITIVWLLFYVFLGMTNAPNNDMNPRINGGDMVFYYRLNKKPSINDVIVFRKKGLRRVGRVIARGGDTVEIVKTGGVIVNGNKLVEHNIYEGTVPYEKFVKYPITLKKNEFFVLVDARESGEDSRFFGPVQKSEIHGIVIGLFRRLNI